MTIIGLLLFELSTKKNKLKTTFYNGLYPEWKGLRVMWWYCLSHKDLIIKSIKNDNYWLTFVL